MKPTLNEEIGMSQEAIDYVNSLEVKDENILLDECSVIDINQYKKLSIVKEKERIKKQSQKVWACVFLAIVIIVTYFLNR